MNLDGTDASLARTLPRIELRTSPRGWACVCHLEDRTSRVVVLAHSVTAAAARRACVAACAPLLRTYELELRRLTGADAE